MRAQTVDIRESNGRMLCSTVFRPCGKKLLAKGHLISEEDIHLLEREGMDTVWVTELEDGEIGEDDAVMAVASEVGCGSIEIRPVVGGRANLVATEDCCLLVDEGLLKQVNCTRVTVVATAANFSSTKAGQRIATVKSAPFAVAQAELDEVISMLRCQGPVLQARPIRAPSIGVVYADPANGERARQLFDNVMRQRLERCGIRTFLTLAPVEEVGAVARSLEHLLRSEPTAILVASTTAPAGPEDTVGQAMQRIGCHLERYLAPVEPGNLLLLAYKDDIPIVSAPGCFRSAKPNVVDLLLPPLLARYRISGWEVAGLGHGGLLT